MATTAQSAARWTRRGPVNILLYPVSLIYRALAWIDRWRYAAGLSQRQTVAVPVVVVGNISVGGTGKSPLTRAIVAHLALNGLKPGIVLRGYGGSNVRGATALRVEATSDPSVVGDEALEHALFSGAPVAVGASRADAAALLVEQAGCDVIVSDDGLQHHALARDIEIAVIDGSVGLGNGWLLPAGPLREPASRLQRVEHVVVNKSERDTTGYDGQPRMVVAIDAVQSLADGATPRSIDASGLADAPEVHAIAGLGNPGRFFAALENGGLTVKRHAFADHHRFIRGDIPVSTTASVVMTGKDMVKVNALFEPDDPARTKMWCAIARADIDSDWLDALTAQIQAVAAAAKAPPSV